MQLIDASNANGTTDTIDQGVVYVYCSIAFPFYRGEQYHMFHRNVVLHREVPDEYLVDASNAAKARGWDEKTCSETDIHTTNLERLPCGKYQVRCDTTLKTMVPSEKCTAGTCIDCTSELQALGLNCATNPTTSSSSSTSSINPEQTKNEPVKISPAAFGAAPLGGTEFETIMSNSSGSCIGPVQTTLRWGVDQSLADRIGCHNRRGAEHSGYWTELPLFTAAIAVARKYRQPVNFYDSVTGKLLFSAPRGRTLDEFLTESTHHGWPSFRDAETVMANVRQLPDGETISIDGTHLGHNLPDGKNRYCIDLVSVAGYGGSALGAIPPTRGPTKKSKSALVAGILAAVAVSVALVYLVPKLGKYGAGNGAISKYQGLDTVYTANDADEDGSQEDMDDEALLA